MLPSVLPGARRRACLPAALLHDSFRDDAVVPPVHHRVRPRPEHEPVGFQAHFWRYPVRIDIAIEYLCITPEEYTQLFGGTWPKACGAPTPTYPPGTYPPGTSGNQPIPRDLYGFSSYTVDNRSWNDIVVRVPEFLRRTCLSYCEFFDLWKSGYVPFRNGADRRYGDFPECEPCCLEDLWIAFPEGTEDKSLYQLAIFIRLWRKLRGACGPGYSFVELADICTVLQLFDGGGAVNPDFIRQLAAFQMLRDEYGLPLIDHHAAPAPGATGADRTHILALWVGPAAATWSWAVHQLVDRVQHYACTRCHGRYRPELIKLLKDNLDPLSKLAGFDPTVPPIPGTRCQPQPLGDSNAHGTRTYTDTTSNATTAYLYRIVAENTVGYRPDAVHDGEVDVRPDRRQHPDRSDQPDREAGGRAGRHGADQPVLDRHAPANRLRHPEVE